MSSSRFYLVNSNILVGVIKKLPPLHYLQGRELASRYHPDYSHLKTIIFVTVNGVSRQVFYTCTPNLASVTLRLIYLAAVDKFLCETVCYILVLIIVLVMLSVVIILNHKRSVNY